MQFYFVPELGVTLNHDQMRQYRETGVSPLASLTAAHEAKQAAAKETVEAPVKPQEAPDEVLVPNVDKAPVKKKTVKKATKKTNNKK